MRIRLADPTIVLNVVPVDTVTNMMIVLAWHIATQSKTLSLQQKVNMLPVINCCGTGERIGKKCPTIRQGSKCIIILSFHISLSSIHQLIWDMNYFARTRMLSNVVFDGLN
jgi:hypothetical protein